MSARFVSRGESGGDIAEIASKFGLSTMQVRVLHAHHRSELEESRAKDAAPVEVIEVPRLLGVRSHFDTRRPRPVGRYFAGRFSWQASTIFVGSIASLSTCSATTFPSLSMRNV